MKNYLVVGQKPSITCRYSEDMYVLKPKTSSEPYLVISHWDSEESFKAWTQSPAFLEGHKRAFADLAQSRKAEGQDSPYAKQF